MSKDEAHTLNCFKQRETERGEELMFLVRSVRPVPARMAAVPATEWPDTHGYCQSV